MPAPELKPRKRRVSPFAIWIAVLFVLLALGVCLLVLGLTGAPLASLSVVTV